MSQTKVFAASATTPVRVTDDNTLGQGSGHSTRLYVGRQGSAGTRRNYDSFLKFTNDWSGVGKIVSAVLSVYTDDFGGEAGFGPYTGSADPYVVVRRLGDSFTEGTNADGAWDSGDYTTAFGSTSGQRAVHMQKAANLVTSIDITDIYEEVAPKNVKRRNGKPCGNLEAAGKWYGIGLFGTTNTAQNWSGWSRFAAVQYRPIVTLTYELGPTTPNAPTSATPVGSVASVGAFQGDFTDPRPTDTLARTQVQVYTSAAKSGNASDTTDLIASSGHGLKVGAEVWFHSLTGGSGLSTATRYYVRSVPDASHFKVSTAPGGAVVNITATYTALTFASPYWTTEKVASETEVLNDRFNVVPDGLHLAVRTNYLWRARMQDQEGLWSPWNAVLTFQVTNTDPNAPTTTPANAFSTPDLNNIKFAGGFSDPDAGDTLLAYEVQMSAYPSGDTHWDDASFILWDTGKTYVPSGSTTWSTLYGGVGLAAGTYYWRARVWDNHDGVSGWTYHSIILTSAFNPDPGTQTTLRTDPHAPWRVLIKEMKFNQVGGNLTGVAATNLITSASRHGLGVGRKVRFGSLTGGAGLFVGQDYYVIASGLTATAFKVSTVAGGPEVDFTTAITAGTVTAVTTRGPGNVIAIFEHAKSVGGTIVYNSPGDMHFTLTVDDPQIAVVEPKQTHYVIQHYSGDGWRETFAGLVDNYDATETSAVITGIDYLGLLDYTMDERYFPSDPNRSFAKGGSYYANQTLRTVVVDQLTKVAKVTDSPVGFIGIGSVATMNEKVSIYATMQPVLSFVAGLLDSHRQGSGKKTRIQVKKNSSGQYQFVVTDDPGQTRDNLRLRYGELVQGYRVVPFGPTWASVINSIGRTREGIRVLYKTKNAPGIDTKVWGRFARAIIMDNVSDELDLDRRGKQAAIHAGKLGQNMGIGVRSGVLKPLDGYDICDAFPVSIIHGIVNTTKFGSGYFILYGLSWEAGDDASSSTSLTLLPRDDTTAPATDLISAKPINPQQEWQVGFTPPNPTKATSQFWLDQTTGIVYTRSDMTAIVSKAMTATASTDLVHATAHGFNANDRVVFASLSSGSAGLDVNSVYRVMATGLTANDFQVTEDGLTAVDISSDIASGTVSLVARAITGTA